MSYHVLAKKKGKENYVIIYSDTVESVEKAQLQLIKWLGDEDLDFDLQDYISLTGYLTTSGEI